MRSRWYHGWCATWEGHTLNSAFSTGGSSASGANSVLSSSSRMRRRPVSRLSCASPSSDTVSLKARSMVVSPGQRSAIVASVRVVSMLAPSSGGKQHSRPRCCSCVGMLVARKELSSASWMSSEVSAGRSRRCGRPLHRNSWCVWCPSVRLDRLDRPLRCISPPPSSSAFSPVSSADTSRCVSPVRRPSGCSAPSLTLSHDCSDSDVRLGSATGRRAR
mmetsp:Transcript_6215/g.16047  ORF Transcript_6215/g.16047 Transcript_6215/m.16047 type:complete len:218 (-) Transcript_6215:113-766(-)